MPRKGGKHVVLVTGAEEAMRAFKQEVAADLGLLDKMGPEMSYRGLSTIEVGNIGGEMVRRMQAAGEFAIWQRFKNGEKRLMPEEVLPDPRTLRSVSNNGNLVDDDGTIIEGNMETISQMLRDARRTNAEYAKAKAQAGADMGAEAEHRTGPMSLESPILSDVVVGVKPELDKDPDDKIVH